MGDTQVPKFTVLQLQDFSSENEKKKFKLRGFWVFCVKLYLPTYQSINLSIYTYRFGFTHTHTHMYIYIYAHTYIREYLSLVTTDTRVILW